MDYLKYFSDDSLLMFENGSDKYPIDDYFPTENGKSGWWYRTKVKIPKNLECEHCVLQWRYHTGTFAPWYNFDRLIKIISANSWGSDENGSGLGFGPQEEFYGCADVSFYPKTSNGPPTTTHKTVTTRPGTIVTRPTTAPTMPPSVGDGNFCSNKTNGLYQHPKCTKFYQESFQWGNLRS